MMRLAQFRPYDVANGPGIRSSLFVSGCSHACPGCFNEEYQDYSYGEVWSKEMEEEVIDQLRKPEVQGLTLLGGEPMEHAKDLYFILQRIQEVLRAERLEKDFWIYSGYTLEEILADSDKAKLLSLCDVLIDGLFVDELKDPSLAFRGSSNQRVINLNDLDKL